MQSDHAHFACKKEKKEGSKSFGTQAHNARMHLLRKKKKKKKLKLFPMVQGTQQKSQDISKVRTSKAMLPWPGITKVMMHRMAAAQKY